MVEFMTNFMEWNCFLGELQSFGHTSLKANSESKKKRKIWKIKIILINAINIVRMLESELISLISCIVLSDQPTVPLNNVVSNRVNVCCRAFFNDNAFRRSTSKWTFKRISKPTRIKGIVPFKRLVVAVVVVFLFVLFISSLSRAYKSFEMALVWHNFRPHIVYAKHEKNH